MHDYRNLIAVLTLAPGVALAQAASPSSFVLVLYGLIGISGAAAFLLYLWGIIVYLVRTGTVAREEGIHIIEWGVAVLIAVLILIGILRFMQA